jgi:hypothetical protein
MVEEAGQFPCILAPIQYAVAPALTRNLLIGAPGLRSPHQPRDKGRLKFDDLGGRPAMPKTLKQEKSDKNRG